MKTKALTTKTMALCALFAALTAVCAQITLPIGPVPISLSLLPVLLCAALMRPMQATVAMLVYLFLGLAGLPVFSNLTGGAAKLFGVTGGYIIGYVPCAFVAAWLMTQWGKAFWRMAAAMAVGVMVCYAFGTAWFMLTKHMGLMQSLSLCVFPFLPGDAVKIVLAALLAGRLKKPLKSIVA